MRPIEVDARGLRCPLPVIRLATAARDLPQGSVITVLATDPAARHDVPAWCRMRNHQLLEVTEVSGGSGTDAATAEGINQPHLRFVVVLGPQPPKAAGNGSGSARSSRAT
ncbi:MAG: sulfurtransferase TusA family protein [Dermatophilaceae bacterium]